MGELEKEVRKRLTILHDSAKNTKSPLGDTVTKIVDLSFVPILDKLDEAKKEFEEILSSKYHPEPTQNRILKWFEEWFGDNGKAEK